VLRTGRHGEQQVHSHSFIRISVMGDFDVRRADGSSVAAEEWRTGKTADLVRLLALRNGRPVRTDGIIEKLWPAAPTPRARASLRTASSQIRRALQTNCVVRERDGLVLQGAWVDAVAFEEAHRRVGTAVTAGQHREVVTLARQAEELYRGDFHAYADDSEWAWTERERLRRLRHELLCDAARSALVIHQDREALRFAQSAQVTEPASEIANRLLMRAHAATGEVSTALRLFNTYRLRLADELGVDPSPQTQALYLQLLRGDHR
jgi:two-component SAPR family response regulator